MKTPTSDQVRKILDHKRAVATWILAPVLRDGKPAIDKVARIVWALPADGAGRLSVCVTDWGMPDGTDYRSGTHYVGHAGGYGYDKSTAALCGCRVGGVELGDHCDSQGRMRLSDLVHQQGWLEVSGQP